jgi:hypothetical protein
MQAGLPALLEPKNMKNTGNNRTWRWLSSAYTLAAWLGLAFSFTQLAHAVDSLCATVKIEIQQELTLERQAFDAHMRINNGLNNIALEKVGVEVTFADVDGNAVSATSDPNNTTALFFIRIDSMQNIENVSGSGKVSPSTSADIHWLIIPAFGAAKDAAAGVRYLVGARLTYNIGADQQVMDVVPDSILVKPMPKLELDYFLPGEVYGDDPFTLAIELPVPYYLGVRVRNAGAGVAGSVRIDSGQPKIVENELGLLIGFSIIGSEVNGSPVSDSLLVNFGDIQPNRSGVARWVMTSTLSGRFVEFTAHYTHADELGGQLTSLISGDPRTHLLVHDVLVDLPGRDVIRDFLAKDGDVLRVYESENTDNVVLDLSSHAALSASGAGYTLSVSPSGGPFHVKLPDPFNGSKIIRSARRGDGKNINLANAWFSQTFDHQTTRWNSFANLFDVNNPGGLSYQFLFDQAPGIPNRPPKLDPLSDWTIAPGNYLNFIVSASDPDGDKITFSLGAGAPEGVTLDANTGSFSWHPTEAQVGTHVLQVTATDTWNPPLTDTTPLTITVKKSNEPPVVALSVEQLNYRGGDNDRILDAQATVTDPDSANFDQGALTVTIKEGRASADVLGIRSQGSGDSNVTVSDTTVFYGADPVGTLTLKTDDANVLTVAFNSAATAPMVQAVLRQVTFSNSDGASPPSNRTLEFVLADGDGGTSAPVDLRLHLMPKPRVTWENPAGIVYGTPLTAVQLNASADVPGTFAYSPPSGTVLGAGNQRTLSATFTPDDPDNYNAVDASVQIDVATAPLTITADDKTKVFGQPLPTLTAHYTGFVNGDAPAVVSGVPGFSTPATASSPVGSYPIVPSLGTLSAANYQFGPFVNGTLTVTAATLSLSVTPLSVPKLTPTTVTFQLYVPPNANFIKTSPNVQRQNGTTWAVVAATMYDDGTHGDAVANDGIYTAQLALNESTAGSISFRSSVAYKGQIQRSFSNTVVVQVAASTGKFSLAIKLDDSAAAQGKAAPPSRTRSSLLRSSLVRVEQEGTAVVVSVSTVLGKSYVLEFTNDLAQPEWIRIRTIAGDGEMKSFSDHELTDQGYYRVREE